MIFLQKTKTELHSILFEVTQECNLNCKFCYNHWKANPVARSEEVSYDDARGTLKKLFKSNHVKQVTFTGGEPLLYERIQELILYCRMKGASVAVITNGSTGNAEIYANLMQVGVSLFELPFHTSRADIHDRMTGVIGSWQKTLASIQYIKKMGGNVVPVMVITKYNFEHIGEGLQYLHEHGISRVMLNRYNIGGYGVHNYEKVLPATEELNKAFQQANTVAQALKMEIYSSVCTPHCVVDPKLYNHIKFSNCTLDVSKRPITLTAKGDIRFCNHSPSVMGNIHELPFQKIVHNWNSTNNVTQPNYCLNCLKYEKCLGGCRAASEQVGKTFNNVDPIVEHIKTA